jgi:hypothetical protein
MSFSSVQKLTWVLSLVFVWRLHCVSVVEAWTMCWNVIGQKGCDLMPTDWVGDSAKPYCSRYSSASLQHSCLQGVGRTLLQLGVLGPAISQGKVKNSLWPAKGWGRLEFLWYAMEKRSSSFYSCLVKGAMVRSNRWNQNIDVIISYKALLCTPKGSILCSV